MAGTTTTRTTDAPAPPGPKGVPGLGVLPWLAKDPAEACTRFRRRYGDVVRLPVLTGSVYLLTHPEDVEHVLVRANRNHWKGRMFNRTDFLFGRGLVLNDGDGWQQQRRVAQPWFTAQQVESLTPALAALVERRGDRWESVAAADGVVEMESEMMSLTLELVALGLLGDALDEAVQRSLGDAFSVVLDHLGVRMATFALPSKVPVPGEPKARRALDVIERYVADVVDRRTSMPDAARPDDLLTALVRADMSPTQRRDEVVTLLFGGYEATAHALAWTWHLLDRHRDVADDVRAEGDAYRREGDRRGLVLTRAVIDEALRLYPPFWEVLRSSHDDDVVGGYRIPGASTILLSPYTTHRMPEVWDAPDAFRPQRWLTDGPAHKGGGTAYFPFGAGQRACIGRHLALLEMQLVLALLGTRFRPTAVTPGPVRQRAQSTLRSKDGMRMRLEPLTR